MSIKYEPSKIIKYAASKAKIKKLLSSRLTFKKAALNFVDAIDFIDKKNVATTALKVIKEYKKRIKNADDKGDERKEIKQDPKLLINRVQNAVILQIKDEIKSRYFGEAYVWLPSDADEPDPEHQLNYGKTFKIGSGEMPGDRIGCRCGMEILTNETKLNL